MAGDALEVGVAYVLVGDGAGPGGGAFGIGLDGLLREGADGGIPRGSGGQAFEYTILQGGRTTTVVTSEGGLRVGDCVSVERGGFNNLRLVDDSRCAPGARTTAPASDRRQADACVAAKDALMRAETDEAFDRAERRVRLQCQD